MNANLLTLENITQSLKAQPFRPVYNRYPSGLLRGDPRPAAVLIPLIWVQDAWQVLFIRRTEVPGDMHSGQVALPGGKREEDDPSLRDAALRETQEELGIHPGDVTILGQLNEFLSISNFRVTPFVGTLPWPSTIQIDPREVARWFSIPLAWLADPANRSTSYRELPRGMGKVGVIYFDRYDGELLWGLSARIITELLDTLGLNHHKSHP